MKKNRVSWLLILISVLLICGCEKSIVSDAETGQIEVGKVKNDLIDGVYTVSGAYFNNEGYSPVLSTKVENGVIVAANFEYFDYSANSYRSKEKEEKAEELHALIKALNTKLLQYQSADALKSENDTKLQNDYYTLAVSLFANMKKGAPAYDSVSQSVIYVESSSYDDDGYRYRLSVSYFGKNIEQIIFGRYDENGEDFAKNRALVSRFNAYSDLPDASTYDDFIAYLCIVDSSSLKKSSIAKGGEELLKNYNELAGIIEKHHRKYTDQISAL